MLGLVTYFNDWAGPWALAPGFTLLACTFFGWFYSVIGENQHGIFNSQVDRSFRMGMMWFIFSEVMFFAAFFGALFYARTLSTAWLGGRGVKIFTNILLWPHYDGTWPTNGPGHVGGHADGSADIACQRSASGHQHRYPALEQRHGDHRAPRIAGGQAWRAEAVPGGFFIWGSASWPAAHEYGEAYRELGLPRLSTGIYGSTFFFDGALRCHAIDIMLTVVWLRVLRGRFTPDKHFAFSEAMAGTGTSSICMAGAVRIRVLARAPRGGHSP